MFKKYSRAHQNSDIIKSVTTCDVDLQVLWPEYNVRSLQFWAALWVGARHDADSAQPPAAAHTPATAPAIAPATAHNTHTRESSSHTVDNEAIYKNTKRKHLYYFFD